ncbi:MAG: Rrf2 family transcriptional regulator [Kutzneria sp.]|nr:Rrf2 family transcriptional regulator [Kutzneria sp.]
MRVSSKADYALRAMVQLAADTDDGPVTATRLADEQGIPLKFLHTVLSELRRARLVRSTRGPDGGFELWRPAHEITLADVLRTVDGPLVNVHDTSLVTLSYPGPARRLRDVWMAARVSLRDVFERVTVADLMTGQLPEPVTELADRYRRDVRHT